MILAGPLAHLSLPTHQPPAPESPSRVSLGPLAFQQSFGLQLGGSEAPGSQQNMSLKQTIRDIRVGPCLCPYCPASTPSMGLFLARPQQAASHPVLFRLWGHQAGKGKGEPWLRLRKEYPWEEVPTLREGQEKRDTGQAGRTQEG